MAKTKTTAPEVETEVAPAAATVTPAELALAFGTDPKTMRRFLRTTTQAKAGKGGRWAIDAALVPELKTRWDARSSASATITELPTDEVVDSEVEDDDEVEELEDIDG